MVTYSFKSQFVNPVRLGLGLDPLPDFPDAREPKRQTIRGESKKRHARPGEELQFYYGMRTRNCLLIGRAKCILAEPIVLFLAGEAIAIGVGKLSAEYSLDHFAKMDGLGSWTELAALWAENHPGIDPFPGVLIQWGELR